MAQSALTVTPPSPTPPTNIVNVGATGPNPATFDPLIYVNTGTGLDGLGDPHYPRPASAPYYDDSITQDNLTAESVNENIPPSGTTASPQAFAAKKAALLVGGTSVDHEGLGTEVVFIKVPGSGPNDYNPAVSLPMGTKQMQTVGTGPAATAATREAGPNASHASTMSPAVNPTFTGLLLATAAAAPTGTQLITCQGANLTPGCRIWVDGIERATTFVGAASITCTINKKPTAGVWVVDVKLGGVSLLSPRNFTWT